MQPSWYIDYYELPAGKKPVEEFINALDTIAQVKVIRSLELLEEFGTKIGHQHAKKLVGTPLWELRILGSNNLRILYIVTGHNGFLLLNAFKKKKQKTEIKELKTALRRLKEYQSRKQ